MGLLELFLYQRTAKMGFNKHPNKYQKVYLNTNSIKDIEKIHSIKASAATMTTEYVCTGIPYDPSYVWVETGHGHSSSHNNYIKNQHMENARR